MEKNEKQLREDLEKNLNGLKDKYISFLAENCTDDVDLNTDFKEEDIENLRQFIKDENLTNEYKINPLITDKQFITEENEEEVLSVIESFLNRWIEKFVKEGFKNCVVKNDMVKEAIRKQIYNHLPTDKQKAEIVKDMIKCFNEYKI